MSEFGGEVAGGGGESFIPGPRVKTGPQQWTIYGNALPLPWIAVGDGVVTFPDARNGGVNVRVLPPSNKFLFIKPDREQVDMTEEPRFTIVCTWSGNGNCWFGFANSPLATVNDFDNNATMYVASRQITGSNVKLKSCDGVARTETTSSIAYDALQHVWEILVKPGEVQLIRDGVVIITKTDRLPPVGNLMQFFIQPIDNALDSTMVLREIWVEFLKRPPT